MTDHKIVNMTLYGEEEGMIQRYEQVDDRGQFDTHRYMDKAEDGDYVLFVDHLDELARFLPYFLAIVQLSKEVDSLRRRVEWERCNEDTGEGIVCNAELVDGGEERGIFCPLCELRDENAGLKEYSESRDESIAVYREEIKELREALDNATNNKWSDWQLERAKIKGAETANAFRIIELGLENAELNKLCTELTKEKEAWVDTALTAAKEIKELKERLREINDILYNPTDDDAPPFRHYGYEEQIRRIKKVNVSYLLSLIFNVSNPDRKEEGK